MAPPRDAAHDQRSVAADTRPALTDRELDILTLASTGLTARVIGEELCISSLTVKTHFENIRGKLGVRDRTAAVAYALRTGLIN